MQFTQDIIDIICYGDFSCMCILCRGNMKIKIVPAGLLVLQLMVYDYNSVFHVYIFPCQSGKFAHPAHRTNQECNLSIHVPVMLIKVRKKSLLLLSGQRFPFLVCALDNLQSPFCWVVSDQFIINCHIEHRRKQLMIKADRSI